MYFQYHLEDPTWVTPEMAEKWATVIAPVRKRMELLEEALMLSGLPGEQFSKGAKVLFDQGLLDYMEPIDVASMAAYLSQCSAWEPRMEWPNAEVVVDTAFVTTREWEVIRTLGIGGSDTAAVLNISPFRGPQAVYHDKVGTKMAEVADGKREYIFSYGHSVEPVVINEFCRAFGAVQVPETRMFRHKNFSEITANTDAIVSVGNGQFAVFEAKTAAIQKRKEWLQGVPPYYRTQCVQYMGVLDDPRVVGTYIGCVFNNNPDDCVFHFVPRDTQAEKEQFAALNGFWRNCVLAKQCPPLSGRYRVDSELMKNLDTDEFALVTDRVLTAPHLQTVCEQYSKAEEWRKQKAAELYQAEEIKAEMEFYLQQQLGTAGGAICGAYTVRQKFQKGKTTVNAQKLKRKYPEAFEDCKKVGLNKRKIEIIGG